MKLFYHPMEFRPFFQKINRVEIPEEGLQGVLDLVAQFGVMDEGIVARIHCLRLLSFKVSEGPRMFPPIAQPN